MANRSRKICTHQELLEFRESARREGRTIVHCHGCFDIVHPGHIHHLQFARSLGDHLVVSVSSDSNVNKGVNRPLIPDDLRAASLAALECVDRVYLNPDPTAVELISELRPDIYVKGREYESNTDPRFLAERDAVVTHGGRVVFSSGDIIFSSTALIGEMKLADALNDEKLSRFCRRHDLSLRSLSTLTQKFRGMRVVVVGDMILDRYHFCDADGVAGEAPMLALRTLERRDYDGGAAIVAQHLAAMGASPTLLTTVAEDDVARQSEMRLRSAGIEVRSLPTRRQSVVKHRYLVDESKLMKVDEGAVAPLDSSAEETLATLLLDAADGAGAVVFTDFGYGTITAGLLDSAMPTLRRAVPIITADVSGRQTNLLRFRGVDLLCPTEREARETMHDFSSGLGTVVSHLLQSTAARQALITLGKQGLVSFDWPGGSAKDSQFRLRSEYVPALSARSIDPLGCGDALLATASLALAAGGSLQAAAMLGSLAASVEVNQIGNVPVTGDDLLRALGSRAESLAPARLAG